MQFVCEASTLHGALAIPGSKSHTIRAVVIAALAPGESVIEAPLASADTLSAVHACHALGAETALSPDCWRIRGAAGLRLRSPLIDVGNSGTTLNVLLGTAALLAPGQEVVLTGDEQIRRRPCGPLVAALNDLGAKASCHLGNGCPPVTVQGRLLGGRTSVEARTSQYISSLLLCCPLAAGDSTVAVPLLNEKPYVQITLDWLANQGVAVEHEEMRLFHIPGRQAFKPFKRRIPGDFSTATFFLGAGALGPAGITCTGLDLRDSQPDKAVIDYLRAMGAAVSVEGDSVTVAAGSRGLQGIEIDMNETPDALPMMAVVGCFAEGVTRLRNVAHARIKETDRIAVMACELRKMGARIRELEDGLEIHRGNLTGATVAGHGDHRVVMSLALAGMHSPGVTTVTSAEAAGVTFPEFASCIAGLGGRLRVEGN